MLNTPEIPLTHFMPDVSSHLCGKVTLVEVGYLIATWQSATSKLHDIIYKIVQLCLFQIHILLCLDLRLDYLCVFGQQTGQVIS